MSEIGLPHDSSSFTYLIILLPSILNRWLCRNWFFFILLKCFTHSKKSRRVHVSSRTLGFLGDQFEVEAAHGEKREQVLRTAGIETYFILRARNPVPFLYFKI